MFRSITTVHPTFATGWGSSKLAPGDCANGGGRSAIGGIKSVPLNKMLAEHPERAIEIAVKGMLPKGPLGRKIFKKLHVFAGGTHPHAAQQPTAIEIA